MAGPVPEVRVAPGVRTFIVFDAPLAPESVRLEGDGTRVRLVDVGARSVIVEPLVELGQDGAILRIGFADGKAPQVAALALVSHPSEVDKEVEVSREALSVDALQATLAALQARCEAQGAELVALQARGEAGGLAALGLAGVLGPQLTRWEFRLPNHVPSAVRLARPWGLDTQGHWVLGAELLNVSPHAWSASGARLVVTPPGGAARVLPVHLEKTRLAPREKARLVVEDTGTPPPRNATLVLELTGADGAPSLSIKLRRE